MARGKAAKKDSLSIEERLAQALVPDWEQPYKVPGNWVWTRLQQVILPSKEKTEQFSADMKYVGLEHISKGNGITGYGNSHEIKSLKSVFAKGQILYGRLRPYLNKHSIADFSGVCSTDILVFNATKIVENKLVNYFFDLDEFIDYAINNSKGINLPRISEESILQFSFPLAPLAEQQRIVDRIESLFSKLDEAKEKAQAALDSFENRKAAILHKAFTGELTQKWREENKTGENDYLQNIKKYLAKLSKKDRIRVEEQLDSIEAYKIHGWLKCSVGAIGIVSNGSTPSRKVAEYWNGSISWVSSGEVKNNIISSTKEFITEDGFNNSSVNFLPKGTVLIAMIGEGKTRGQSAILDIEATINQNIAAIVVNIDYVLPKFLWYCFQKNYTSNREKGGGSGPQALNCQRVRELDFILPPLPEQIEIVRILDSIFEKEQQSKELASVIEKIDLMKKAILARAFRGELGTNDPKEESSIELLKEILEVKS